MPYQYGTANNADDLLGKLREFLLANGFTVNLWVDDASSYRTYSGSASSEGKRLHVQRGSVYWNFRSAVRASVVSGSVPTSSGAAAVDGFTQYRSQFTGLAGCPSTGFDGAKTWDKQPGAPTLPADPSQSLAAGAKCFGAIPSYRFFLDLVAMEMCISIEHEVGKWRHLILGTMRKYGSFDGGAFCAGCTDMYSPRSDFNLIPFNSDPFVQPMAAFAKVDGVGTTGWAMGPTTAGGEGYRLTGLQSTDNRTGEVDYLNSGNMDVNLLASEPSAYTSIVPLIPIRLGLILSSSPYAYQLLGEVTGLRIVRMDGYSPGDIITMGAERWMVLPLTYKETGKVCAGFAIPYDGV